MIGFLRGILLDKETPNLTVDANGIGYEIQMAISSFANLPPVGKEVALYIHLVTREDGNFLYGFVNKEQRALFRALIKISGIGPKIALAILSAMEPHVFARHLTNNDATAFEHISGIGAKTAKRLFIEMKDKVSDWEHVVGAADDFSANDAVRDAIGALVALGYKPHEARHAFRDLQDKNLSSEELIRLALKKIR
jgi:holliday junction DNA helicase RuvA